MAIMVNFFVHLNGFSLGVGTPVSLYLSSYDVSVSRRGPHSCNRPNSEDAPGPPLYHSTVGAVAGFSSAITAQ